MLIIESSFCLLAFNAVQTNHEINQWEKKKISKSPNL